MNLTCTIFSFALLTFPIYADSTIPPIYANCSTLPLYGKTGGPSIDDISTLITENGWFEADLAAVVLTNASAIKQCLKDPMRKLRTVPLYIHSEKSIAYSNHKPC